MADHVATAEPTAPRSRRHIVRVSLGLLAFAIVEAAIICYAWAWALAANEEPYYISWKALQALGRVSYRAECRPDDAAAQKEYVEMLSSLGMTQEAYAVAKQARARNPKDPVLAEALWWQADWMVWHNKDYPASEAQAGFYYDQGSQYAVLGRWPDAAASLRRALSRSSGRETWLGDARRLLVLAAKRGPSGGRPRP